MKLSADTRGLYTSVITTAIENSFHREWDEALTEYKWYYPDLDGGSAEPGPDNTANAYAVFELEGGREFRFDVPAVSKARGVMRKVGKTDSTDASRARYLESQFVLGEDSDFDAFDALDVLQFAMFGELVYG